MALNQTKIFTELFPKCSFAFYGNHINRYRQRITKNVRTSPFIIRFQVTPKLDVILSVEDIKVFH